MKSDTSKENIVSMQNFVSKARFPALVEVEAYWQALRNGRDIPRRADLDPRGIEGSLEYSFIVERIAPGVARIRLAGRHLNALMGMEVRGMPITAFFSPETRKDVALRIEEMFQSPGIFSCAVSGEKSLGKPPLEGRMLLLPLKSDLGDVSRALGCLVTEGEIGRTPRRLDMLGETLEICDGPALDKAPAKPRAIPAAEPLGEKRSRFEGTFFDRVNRRTEKAAEPEKAPAARDERFTNTKVPFLRLVNTDD
ncbi:hypothetical protein SAMN05421688_0773 [Poseidonocella pacifica]|uniref:PAS domain-containing protein n=1 Tax=Poseidonocella pacifica TaxID=871651 RepID=A0A1I0VNE9_9RHOB|nr:PAS domain-containing protein [Poseidonocella pacifica]SFA77390.1 hypothetical protein SAMN05421688_0773 [Poseidonocella pacifica]